MKVLVVNRDPSWWVGGDAIQSTETIKSLKKLGIDVTFSSDNFEDFTNYDLVHIFHLNFFWTAKMIERCIDDVKPYIISAIYYDKEYDNNFITMEYYVKNSFKTIALSNNEKKEMVDRFNIIDDDKIVVIPNGINPTIFNKKKAKRKKRIISVGRADDPMKGAGYLVKAVNKLGIDCVYVGKYKDNPFSKGIEESLTCIPRVEQKELADMYRQSAVYVCPSLTERQSLAVLEAAACGCPIVDSIYNRGADLLPSSLIVDPGDTQAMCEAIEKQIGKENTDKVPSWDDVASEIIKLYKEI